MSAREFVNLVCAAGTAFLLLTGIIIGFATTGGLDRIF